MSRKNTDPTVFAEADRAIAQKKFHFDLMRLDFYTFVKEVEEQVLYFLSLFFAQMSRFVNIFD